MGIKEIKLKGIKMEIVQIHSTNPVYGFIHFQAVLNYGWELNNGIPSTRCFLVVLHCPSNKGKEGKALVEKLVEEMLRNYDLTQISKSDGSDLPTLRKCPYYDDLVKSS